MDTCFCSDSNKTTYNCSPTRNSDNTSNELLLNIISSVIESALMSVQKKRINSKRLSQGAINELQTTHEGASSLIALVNQRNRTNFQGLDRMHVHLQKKAEIAEKKQKNMFEPTKLGVRFWLGFCE